MDFEKMKKQILFAISELEKNGYKDDEKLIKSVYQGVIAELRRLSKLRDEFKNTVQAIIPPTTTEIKPNYFQKRKDAAKINRVRVLSEKPPAISKNSFKGISEDAVYAVKRGTAEDFKMATNWCELADNIVEDRR